jgi:hypothetical protein
VRLVGERVTLIPVPHEVSVGVVSGVGLADAVAAAGLTAVPGWPHADTADALRPLAEQGGPGPADGTFLIAVDGELVGECGWVGGPGEDGAVEIVTRVTADALVGNEPSRRVLERLGFRQNGENPPYITYVRDAPHVDVPNESG